MDIRIIDTRVISSPLATLVTLAGQWTQEGCNIDEVVARIYEMLPCCRVFFLVATLEYLAKGGRIGGAQALLGSVLQIKPILTLRDGKVDQFEKERTHKRAVGASQGDCLAGYPPGWAGLSLRHACCRSARGAGVSARSWSGARHQRYPHPGCTPRHCHPRRSRHPRRQLLRLIHKLRRDTTQVRPCMSIRPPPDLLLYAGSLCSGCAPPHAMPARQSSAPASPLRPMAPGRCAPNPPAPAAAPG